MSEIELTVEVLEFKIAELKLKPGAKLAMICPPDWTPIQIVKFQHYTNESAKQRGLDFELLCFPYGTELAVITPAGGFTDC